MVCVTMDYVLTCGMDDRSAELQNFACWFCLLVPVFLCSAADVGPVCRQGCSDCGGSKADCSVLPDVFCT